MNEDERLKAAERIRQARVDAAMAVIVRQHAVLTEAAEALASAAEWVMLSVDPENAGWPDVARFAQLVDAIEAREIIALAKAVQ